MQRTNQPVAQVVQVQVREALARRILEPQGRWESLASQMRPSIQRLVREPVTYLLTTRTKDSAQPSTGGDPR